MKRLLIISMLACPTAWAMHPASVSVQKITSGIKFSAAITCRAFSLYKINEHRIKIPRSKSAWKDAYREYQKALIDREKCKTWKQIGYGMHEGYCTSGKSCDCTYRLALIARK